MNDCKGVAFRALHAVYHDRNFRVRVSDTTIDMIKRALAECVGVNADDSNLCPVCRVDGEDTQDEG